MGQICPKMVFPVQKRRSKHHHCLLRIRFSLDTNFQLKLTILIFSNKFAQKGYFQSKTKKLNITVGFCVFEISQDTNFNLNNFEFWGISGRKRKKVNITTEFCIFELVPLPNISFTDNLDFSICPKRLFPV